MPEESGEVLRINQQILFLRSVKSFRHRREYIVQYFYLEENCSLKLITISWDSSFSESNKASQEEDADTTLYYRLVIVRHVELLVPPASMTTDEEQFKLRMK